MPFFAACERPAQDDFCAGGRDLGGAGTAVAQTGAGAGWTGSCVRPAGHPALCFDRVPPGRQVLDKRNTARRERHAEEAALLRPLPAASLESRLCLAVIVAIDRLVHRNREARPASMASHNADQATPRASGSLIEGRCVSR